MFKKKALKNISKEGLSLLNQDGMALALKILRLTPNTKNIVLGDMPEFCRIEGGSDLDDLGDKFLSYKV